MTTARFITPSHPAIVASTLMVETIQRLATRLRQDHLDVFDNAAIASRCIENIVDGTVNTLALYAQEHIDLETMGKVSKSYGLYKEDIVRLHSLLSGMPLSEALKDEVGPHPMYAVMSMIEAFNMANNMMSLIDMTMSFEFGPEDEIRDKAKAAGVWDNTVGDQQERKRSLPPFLEAMSRMAEGQED